MTNPDLFVMRSDGTHEKRLTHTSKAQEFDATFSPDGEKIAFDSSAEPTSDFDVWMMKANGTHRHKVLDGASDEIVADWARR
jgi:Tol biopolymer transport system component